MSWTDILIKTVCVAGWALVALQLYVCVQLFRPSYWKKYHKALAESQRKEWKTNGGLTTLRFWVKWSEEDKEWVGCVAGWPGLSYLAETKEEALSGIMQIVATEVADPKDPLPIKAELP